MTMMSSSTSPMKARFADWVATADAVRATTKKLEKHAALAGYLSSLEDADLEIAARLVAGAPFSRTDERVLSVGWSARSDVLLERSGKNGEDMAASYQRHADLGDVAGELIGDTPREGEPLTLEDVAQAFDAIAAPHAAPPKRNPLLAIPHRATADEARHLVNAVSADKRIA